MFGRFTKQIQILRDKLGDEAVDALISIFTDTLPLEAKSPVVLDGIAGQHTANWLGKRDTQTRRDKAALQVGEKAIADFKGPALGVGRWCKTVAAWTTTLNPRTNENEFTVQCRDVSDEQGLRSAGTIFTVYLQLTGGTQPQLSVGDRLLYFFAADGYRIALPSEMGYYSALPASPAPLAFTAAFAPTASAPRFTPVKPEISIIMPTYNQSKYIREAVDSVLAQTFTDFELIVVDDGSTDDTASIMRSYDDPRIIFLTKANGGTGSALNLGFRRATAPYETWVASDNVLYPDNLLRMKEFLDGHPDVDWVYGNFEFRVMDETGLNPVQIFDAKDLMNREWAPGKLIVGYFLGIAWLWRRKLRESVGDFWHKPCEDYEFSLRAEEKETKFAFLDEKLSWYREHQDTLTNQLIRENKGLALNKEIICAARTRRFPRKAHFYWGGERLPYLRFLTLATFCRWNPDWEAILYRPHRLSTMRSWEGPDLNYKTTGPDYTSELARLPLTIRTFDPREIQLPEEMSEVHKADALRLWLLGTEGGLWSDMDLIYFAPLNLPLIHDTYLCDGPDGHTIGFLASTPWNPIFQFLLEEARKISATPILAYQGIGADLLNRHRTKFPMMDRNWLNFGYYKDKRIFNIPQTVVYAYDWRRTREIHEPPKGPLRFRQDSIGLHWFGGNPLAKAACDRITPENCRAEKTVLGEAIRRALDSDG